MPNIDIQEIKDWFSAEVALFLGNEGYNQHFSEVITRRLRRQLRPDLGREPRYTHNIQQFESAAFFLLESGFETDIIKQQNALFHEAAIIFEQIAHLNLEPDLQIKCASELLSQRFIISALCYYMAGYEANAVSISNYLLTKNNIVMSSITKLIATLLCKDIRSLYLTLRDIISVKNDSSELIESLANEELIFGDCIFIAAVKVLAKAIACFISWLKHGDQTTFDEAIAKIEMCRKNLADCGRRYDSFSCELLLSVLELWYKRHPQVVFKKADVNGITEQWKRYFRILIAGKAPLTELWRSQIPIFKDILTFDKGIAISMPTSAGKSRVAEFAIVNELLKCNDEKAVYVVPTRSLASEIEENLSQRLSLLGLSVSKLFGGYELSDFEKNIIEKSRILVVTPEKLDLLIRQNREFINSLCLLIIDEAHQIGQGKRGLRLEFIISRIKWLAAGTAKLKIISLSAVLPNCDAMTRWFDTDNSHAHFSNWRPTRNWLLAFNWGELNPNDGQLIFLDNIEGEVEKFIPGMIDRKKYSQRIDAICGLALHLTAVGPVLVFSIKPKIIDEIATNLISVFRREGVKTISTSQETLSELIIPHISKVLGRDHLLVKCLSLGFAFHYGPLPNSVRLVIEEALRNGSIKLVIANETLAQGVNLPLKAVIVDTVHRGDVPMAVRDFWNVAGRAGRACKEIEGMLIFFLIILGNFLHIWDHF